MNPFISSLIGAGVRWGLTMLAARGVVVSDDIAVQLVSAAVAIGTLIWSAVQKQAADRAIRDAALPRR